jgi:hypothetical protein
MSQKTHQVSIPKIRLCILVEGGGESIAVYSENRTKYVYASTFSEGGGGGEGRGGK